MSWRTVVITNRAKLDLKMGYIVVRGDEIKQIHLSEIAVLIIENTAVSLTAALLSELVKRKIKVIFCDEKRNPSSELVPYYGSHDTSDKIRIQIAWQTDIKALVWTEIVSEKIRKQIEVLNNYSKSEEAELLKLYIEQIEIGDITNREGHAAKVYFNALFGKSFSRSVDDLTNAALNYGYMIMLSAISREIVALGYITQIGIFHDNMFNYFNLSSDLIEPFRAIVDIAVLKMHLTKFEKEEKMILVNLFNQDVEIDGMTTKVLNSIKIYCRSIFDAINSRDLSLIKFYKMI